MATFAAHGLLGAGLTAAPLRALNAPRWMVNLGTLYGFTLGSAPDVWDYLGALIGLFPRWDLYVLLHHDPPWYLLANPPFFLHLVMDQFFHDPSRPGWNWWSELWYLEVGMWVLSGLLLWYAYRRQKE